MTNGLNNIEAGNYKPAEILYLGISMSMNVIKNEKVVVTTTFSCVG